MTPAEASRYALGLCDRIAAHTDMPGTITRLFLSPATADVHVLLRAEMQSLGMAVRMDAAGNLRGVLPAANPEAPTLLLGSHLDTVPNAGRYDGILGIAVPLALVALLHGRALPFHVEIIAFSEEEGVRFRLPFIGSSALTPYPVDLTRQDANGVTIAEALQNFGFNPTESTRLTPGTFAFVEVHIEQGPVLESLGIGLGLVETIVGQTRLELTFTGQANHAGTTPMPLRRDALAAAAVFITAVETLALATPGLVATVGVIHAAPGAANIIPGTATLSLDIRHADDCTRLRARRALTAQARSIAAARSLEVRTRQTSQQASVPMDTNLVAQLAAAAEATSQQTRRMVSGAGHDAMILAPHVPSAMLFLRTPAGLSHHPDEAVLPGDVEAALKVLHRFILHSRTTAGI